MNPVLLPPRSRADVVGERPAGGTPQEVAAANPGLAAAVPAAVGKSGPTPADVVTDVEQSNVPDAGVPAKASPGAEGAGTPGMSVADGSGMDVPELAVLPPRNNA